MNMKKYLAVSVILLFISVCVIPSTSRLMEQPTAILYDGNTIYVGGDGHGNYTKIQDAIDNASDEDTVFVYNGTYVENLIVNNSIELIGEGRNTTIIDGGSGYIIVFVSTEGVKISGFTIQNLSYYGGSCIYLSSNNNTIIGNNIFDIKNYGHTSGKWEGIVLSNSNNNIFYNNNISVRNYGYDCSAYGIYLWKSNNNTFSCNNISKNGGFIYDAGLSLSSSNNNTIEENIIMENNNGITIHKSSINKINNNIISSNYFYGIGLHNFNDNNNIINNFLFNNGIDIIRSNSTNISSNSFINDGLSVFKSYNSTVVDNTVNDKSLVYLEDVSNRLIDYGVGQVVLVNCNNITLENLNLSNTSTGVILYETNNSKIRNSKFSANWCGISFCYSSDNCLKDNIIFFNKNDGINLYSSISNTIRGNKIISNKYDGIEFQSSTYNTIIDNCIGLNSGRGILLEYSDTNSIMINNISNNNNGIKINYHSNNNSVYHNKFINNTNNAKDSGKNTWDNGYPSGGNFWDDYKGNDSDGDGIGDTPYSIPGGNNEDRYPLGNFPPDAPTIHGKTSGKAGKEYEYIFNSTDPEGNSVMYFIDWGDNYTEWTEYCDSGEETILKHTWNEKGDYTIKSKTKDSYDAEGKWGYQKVTMPKSYNLIWWLYGLLNKFPLLTRLLEWLMW